MRIQYLILIENKNPSLYPKVIIKLIIIVMKSEFDSRPSSAAGNDY